MAISQSRPRRLQSIVTFGLGALLLLFALVVITRILRPAPHRVSVAAGSRGTMVNLIGEQFCAELNRHGVAATLLDSNDPATMIDALDAGSVDVVFTPASLHMQHHHQHVRQAASLFVEALHLLVKAELGDRVDQSLLALQGRKVWLGPPDSATSQLAKAVLGFAGASPDKASSIELDDDALIALLDRNDPAQLPDAIFVLQVVPSRIAARLVRDHGYRLIPLRFAEAFRLEPFLATEGAAATKDYMARHDIEETVIPAYTYRTAPAVPEIPLATLGTRLLLLTHDRVPNDTVEMMLEVAYGSRFARLSHPPLDDTNLARPARIPRHGGASAYLARDKPYITDERVGALSNALSIIGALGGSLLFLWQVRRQRTQAKRDEVFGAYMRRLAELERRVSEHELATNLQLEPLAELHRELLRLKSEVLEGVNGGELDHAMLPVLLTPLNGARDHVGDLLLHVREHLEEKTGQHGL